MKNALVLLFVLASTSAHADMAGQTHCTGQSTSPGAQPLQLKIAWGAVGAKGPGHLPPYSQDAKQKAVVQIQLGSKKLTTKAVFDLDGGTTRCHWWTKTTGDIAGVASVTLATKSFESCGFPDSGPKSSLVLFPGTAKQVTYQLTCNAVGK